MAASAESCSHCGKQGVGLKRCSRCKQASYCGAECQNANWRRHKKSCERPVPLPEVPAKIIAAREVGDWQGVLKLEGRMEELLAHQSDDVRLSLLSAVSEAHQAEWQAKDSKDHARSSVGLEERRISLLGKLQRFRDQGEAMCFLSDLLVFLGRHSEATTWYQRARDIGAAHGFFSLESVGCIGLGRMAIGEGRDEEGVALLQNALVAAHLNELDDPQYELNALELLIHALFETNSIDEAEPLVLRFREADQARSERKGSNILEYSSIVFSARLHEVLCLCIPRWELHTTAQ